MNTDSMNKNKQWKILGNSKPMAQLTKQIVSVAQYGNTNILIQGERGSGKELAARSIASRGQRAKEAFVIVNCAAIAPELFEAQMLGVQQGDDADDKSFPGFIELANHGVLFLDEVNEIPLALQARLLQVLKQKTCDFQLICATNANLGAMVDEGRFCHELHEQIRTIEINMPPLRLYVEDIPLLMTRFADLIGEQEAASAPLSCVFTPEAINCMQLYDWPGNVSELRQAVEYALFRANGKPVNVGDLRPEIVASLMDLNNGNNTRPIQAELASLSVNQGEFTSSDLSVTLLSIAKMVFEKRRNNRAATMCHLFPGMKASYFGRLAWDLVKMNPGLLDPWLPEGQLFNDFKPFK